MLGAVVFLLWCFLVPFPCAGRLCWCHRGAGSPYPENMLWDWACLSMFFRKVVGFMGVEPKSSP